MEGGEWLVWRWEGVVLNLCVWGEVQAFCEVEDVAAAFGGGGGCVVQRCA